MDIWKTDINQTLVDRDQPRNLDLDFGLWTLDFFYGLRMTQDNQLDLSLSQRLLKHFFDNVLHEHVGLIWVLPLAVHLFFCAEQGVILSNFYSLGFISRGLLNA